MMCCFRRMAPRKMLLQNRIHTCSRFLALPTVVPCRFCRSKRTSTELASHEHKTSCWCFKYKNNTSTNRLLRICMWLSVESVCIRTVGVVNYIVIVQHTGPLVPAPLTALFTQSFMAISVQSAPTCIHMWAWHAVEGKKDHSCTPTVQQ